MAVVADALVGSSEKPLQAGAAGAWSCYLLRSTVKPDRAYIGASLNIVDRLRAHNGQKAGGAYQTRAHRPWELVVSVAGFPSKLDALAFEFAWHYPSKIGCAPGMNHMPLVKSMKAEYGELRARAKALTRGADAAAWGVSVLHLMTEIGKWRLLRVTQHPVQPAAACELSVQAAVAPTPERAGKRRRIDVACEREGKCDGYEVIVVE
jgi:predicted GIY-YIG superfamily endonuclease